MGELNYFRFPFVSFLAYYDPHFANDNEPSLHEGTLCDLGGLLTLY